MYAEEVRLTCISKEEMLSHNRLVTIALEMFKHTSMAKEIFILQYAFDCETFVTVRTDADIQVAQTYFDSSGENSTLLFVVHGMSKQVHDGSLTFLRLPGQS
jgi:hypothetical protein